MSLALSGDTIAYLMGLGLDAEQMKGLIDRLHRDALTMAPPATSSGVNEERERLRNENTKAERKRAADRERMAAKREAERVARLSREQNATVLSVSRDVAATVARDTRDGASDADATAVDPSRTRVRDISPKLVISGSDDDVDCASAVSSSDDWPKLAKRQTHAEILAEAVASPWLDPKKSPGLIETAGRVAAWKREGASWDHDVIPVVTALCVKAGKRIGTWRYFDNAIAQSIADNRAALQIPEARVVPLRPGGFKSRDEQNTEAWDYAISRIAQDE